MRILFYRHKYDQEYESIISSVNKTNNIFGYLHGEISKQNILEFKPDIIMHNIPNAKKFPIDVNAISININETDSKNSFSLSDKKSPNYIEPFVKLTSAHVEEKNLAKFSSDVVYIGSPVIFGDVLEFLTNPNNKLHWRFFSNQLYNISGYCGYCPVNSNLKFYKHSRACLVFENDVNRLRDIIISDGNPIVYNGNSQECIQKIKESVENNIKYEVQGYNKKDIFNNHTSYDRAYQIFKTVGLKKLAESILEKKSWEK
jgi:hypothetical protein